jgi:tetratricopeptide (TPR) repeat protein
MTTIVFFAALLQPDLDVSPMGRSEQILGLFEAEVAEQTDIWFEFGDFPLVVDMLKVQVEVEPDNYRLNTDLIWMLGNISRDEEAYDWARKFRLSNPGNPEAAFPEAQLYYFDREYADVTRILLPTIDMTVKPHPNTYRILAHSLEDLGRFQKSKEVWDLLLELTPEDDAARNNRNRVAQKAEEAGQSP